MIAHELIADGAFCTLGVVGQARGVDLAALDPEDREAVAKAFDIAPALAAEIVYENDESFCDFELVQVEICGPMRPWDYQYQRNTHSRYLRVPKVDAAAKRWKYMRDWVAKNIQPAALTTPTESTS